MSASLNPDKALIFRIVHKDNVPWIFAHGMYCRNSPVHDKKYRTIGNPELIDKRHYRAVPIHPGGTLSDYVPFYFTPFTPMMLNIKTGYGGITKVPSEEVIIFISSLHHLRQMGQQFIFTDRHAYLFNAQFFNDLSDLNQIDWTLLQSRNFKRDPDDPGKIERYQAEALVHAHLPVGAFLGAVCYTDQVRDELRGFVNQHSTPIRIETIPGWYI